MQKPKPTAPPATVHYVEVTLGAPSKDCRGFGICRLERLTTPPQDVQRRDHQAYGTLRWKTPDTLELRLETRSVTRTTYYTYFYLRRTFRVDEPLEIRGFGGPVRWLQPGRHPLEKGFHEITITLRIQETNPATDTDPRADDER